MSLAVLVGDLGTLFHVMAFLLWNVLALFLVICFALFLVRASLQNRNVEIRQYFGANF